MIGVQPIEIPIGIALRHHCAAVHHVRSLNTAAIDFHHRAPDHGGVDVVRARPAFRLLDALPVAVNLYEYDLLLSKKP